MKLRKNIDQKDLVDIGVEHWIQDRRIVECFVILAKHKDTIKSDQV